MNPLIEIERAALDYLLAEYVAHTVPGPIAALILTRLSSTQATQIVPEPPAIAPAPQPAREETAKDAPEPPTEPPAVKPARTARRPSPGAELPLSQRILLLLSDGQPRGNTAIARDLGVKSQTVGSSLMRLKKAGRLDNAGRGWRRTEAQKPTLYADGAALVQGPEALAVAKEYIRGKLCPKHPPKRKHGGRPGEGETAEAKNSTGIDPRYIAQLTGYDAASVRRLIAQVRDEIETEGRKAQGPEESLLTALYGNQTEEAA